MVRHFPVFRSGNLRSDQPSTARPARDGDARAPHSHQTSRPFRCSRFSRSRSAKLRSARYLHSLRAQSVVCNQRRDPDGGRMDDGGGVRRRVTVALDGAHTGLAGDSYRRRRPRLRHECFRTGSLARTDGPFRSTQPDRAERGFFRHPRRRCRARRQGDVVPAAQWRDPAESCATLVVRNRILHRSRYRPVANVVRSAGNLRDLRLQRRRGISRPHSSASDFNIRRRPPRGSGARGKPQRRAQPRSESLRTRAGNGGCGRIVCAGSA